MWQSKPTRQRGAWTLLHDGQEVGTFSTLTELRQPSIVMAKICAALNADDAIGAPAAVPAHDWSIDPSKTWDQIAAGAA